MMRDNLFEVVTTSRTFYIQVGIMHASVWSSVWRAVGSTTEVSLTLLSHLRSFPCVPGWQSRGDAQLDQSCLRSHRGPARSREICCNSMCPCPSCETPHVSLFLSQSFTPTLILVIYDFSDVLSWCCSCWELKRELRVYAVLTLWNVIGDTSVDRLLRPRLPPGWARIRSSAWWNQKWLTHVHTQPDLYTHTHAHHILGVALLVPRDIQMCGHRQLLLVLSFSLSSFPLQ